MTAPYLLQRAGLARLLATLALVCCARPPPAPPITSVETVNQFALRRGDRILAGAMVLSIGPDRLRMDALTPAGTALFRVTATARQTEVVAPDPKWAPIIAQLPLRRDLLLVHAWSCPVGRCSVDSGTIRESVEAGSTVRRYRGAGGPAEVRLSAGRAVLEDPRRVYTVTFLGDEFDAVESHER